MLPFPIAIPNKELIAFCQRHHVRRMSLFGSVLRSDFRPESDVDVLVEFEPEHIPGFIGLMTMQDELTALFGRPVDLLTPKFIHRLIRQKVLNEAQVIYDAA
ncbi:MAG: nucleotidyltransferase family protein [Anaerolineae bacterium]|nr:nucleotidyltransferase family protein [Anaerolineae bacterium]